MGRSNKQSSGSRQRNSVPLSQSLTQKKGNIFERFSNPAAYSEGSSEDEDDDDKAKSDASISSASRLELQRPKKKIPTESQKKPKGWKQNVSPNLGSRSRRSSSSSSSDEEYHRQRRPQMAKTPRGLARAKKPAAQVASPVSNTATNPTSTSQYAKPTSTQVQRPSTSSRLDSSSCHEENNARKRGAQLQKSHIGKAATNSTITSQHVKPSSTQVQRSSTYNRQDSSSSHEESNARKRGAQLERRSLGRDSGSTQRRHAVPDNRTTSENGSSTQRLTPVVVFSSPSKARHPNPSEDDDTDFEITVETDSETTEDDATCDEAVDPDCVQGNSDCESEVAVVSETENEGSSDEMALQDDEDSPSLLASEVPRQSQIVRGQDRKSSPADQRKERSVVEETDSSAACEGEDSDQTMEPLSPPDISMLTTTQNSAVRESSAVSQSGPQSKLGLSKNSSSTSSVSLLSGEERLKDTQILSEQSSPAPSSQLRQLRLDASAIISRLKNWGQMTTQNNAMRESSAVSQSGPQSKPGLSKNSSSTSSVSLLSGEERLKDTQILSEQSSPASSSQLRQLRPDASAIISRLKVWGQKFGNRVQSTGTPISLPVKSESRAAGASISSNKAADNNTASDDELLIVSVDLKDDRAHAAVKDESVSVVKEEQGRTESDDELLSASFQVEESEDFLRATQTLIQQPTSSAPDTCNVSTTATSTPHVETREPSKKRHASADKLTSSDESLPKKRKEDMGPSQTTLSGPSNQRRRSSNSSSSDGRHCPQACQSDLQSSASARMASTPGGSGLQGKPPCAEGAASGSTGRSSSVLAGENFPVHVKTEPGVDVSSTPVVSLNRLMMYSQEERVIIISDSESEEDDGANRESLPSLLPVKQEEQEANSEHAMDSDEDLFPESENCEVYEAEEGIHEMSFGFSPKQNADLSECEYTSEEENRHPERTTIKSEPFESQGSASNSCDVRVKTEPIDPVVEETASKEAPSETQPGARGQGREGSAEARGGVTDEASPPIADLVFREEMPASDVSRFVVDKYISGDVLSGANTKHNFRELLDSVQPQRSPSDNAGMVLGMQVQHEPMDVDEDTRSRPPEDHPSDAAGLQPLPSTSTAITPSSGGIPSGYKASNFEWVKIHPTPGPIYLIRGIYPASNLGIRSALPERSTAASPRQVIAAPRFRITVTSPHQSVRIVNSQVTMPPRTAPQHPVSVPASAVPVESCYPKATQVDDSVLMRQSYNVSPLQSRSPRSVHGTGPLAANPAAVDEGRRDAQRADSDEDDAYGALTQVDPVSRGKRRAPSPPTDSDDSFNAPTQVDRVGSQGDNQEDGEKESAVRMAGDDEDDAFFAATQVDEVSSSLNSLEKPATESADEDPFQAATQMDNGKSFNLSALSSDKGAVSRKSLPDDGGVYSAETQVDRPAVKKYGKAPKRSSASAGRNMEDDDDEDEAYYAATQRDPPVSSSRGLHDPDNLEQTLPDITSSDSDDPAYQDQTLVDDDDLLYHQPTQVDPSHPSKLKELVHHINSKQEKERQAKMIEPLLQRMNTKSIRSIFQARHNSTAGKGKQRKSTSKVQSPERPGTSMQRGSSSSHGSGWLSKSQAPTAKETGSKASKGKTRKRPRSPDDGQSMTQQIKAATAAKNRRLFEGRGQKPKGKRLPAAPDPVDLQDAEFPNTQEVYAKGLPLLMPTRVNYKPREPSTKAITETAGPSTSSGPSESGSSLRGWSHHDAGGSKSSREASGLSSGRESRLEPVTSSGSSFKMPAMLDSSCKDKSSAKSSAVPPASDSSKDKRPLLSESDRKKLHAAKCRDVVVLVEKLPTEVPSSALLSSSFSSSDLLHEKLDQSSWTPNPSSSKLTSLHCSTTTSSSLKSFLPACPSNQTHFSSSVERTSSSSLQRNSLPSDGDRILSSASKTSTGSKNSSLSSSKAGGSSLSKTANSSSKSSFSSSCKPDTSSPLQGSGLPSDRDHISSTTSKSASQLKKSTSSSKPDGSSSKTAKSSSKVSFSSSCKPDAPSAKRSSSSSSSSHKSPKSSRPSISSSHKSITSGSKTDRPHSSSETSEKSKSKKSHSLPFEKSDKILSKSSSSLTSASKAWPSSKASNASASHRSANNLPQTYDVVGGIMADMSKMERTGPFRSMFDKKTEGSMASKQTVGPPATSGGPVSHKPSSLSMAAGGLRQEHVSSASAALGPQAPMSSVLAAGSRELSSHLDPNSSSCGRSTNGATNSSMTTTASTSTGMLTSASTSSINTSAAASTTSSVSTCTTAAATKSSICTTASTISSSCSSIPSTGISSSGAITPTKVSSSSTAPSQPALPALTHPGSLSAVERQSTPRGAPVAPGNPCLPVVGGFSTPAANYLRQAASHPPLATGHPHPPLAAGHPPQVAIHPPLAGSHPPLAAGHPPQAAGHPPTLASILEARPRRASGASARLRESLPPVLDSQGRPNLDRRVSTDRPERKPLTLDDFYFRVVKWNTSWFEEQACIREAPPVAKSCYPLVDSYANLSEYQEITMNLLLYETWEDVSRDWVDPKRSRDPMKLILQSQSKVEPDMQKLTWIGLENRRDMKGNNLLVTGTVAIVRWKEKMEGGKKGLIQKFAYIKTKQVLPHAQRGNYPSLSKLSAEPGAEMVSVTMLMRDNFDCAHFVGGIVEVELVSNIITRIRQASALCSLKDSVLQQDILKPVDQQSQTFRWPAEKKGKESQTLNPQQAKVVNQMMAAVTDKKRKFIGLLQGPPGTGKSHTIVSLLRRIHLHDRSARVLLAAPSNNATDELVRRLVVCKRKSELKDLSIVRIGRSGLQGSEIDKHSLDSRVQELWRKERLDQTHSLPDSVKDQVNRVQERLRREEERLTACKPSEKRLIEGEIRKLKKEMDKLLPGRNNLMQRGGHIPRNKEEELKRKALREAHVVCGTLNSFGHNRILDLCLTLNRGSKDPPFVCAIIDEATQALEVDSLIPLQYNINTLLLVGDPEQLPATCVSQTAEASNFGMSLFERCFKLFKDMGRVEHMHMLNVQHRMDPEVCNFPNAHVYHNRLINHSTVQRPPATFKLRPYLFFNLNSSQEHSSQPGSISNQSEALFIAKLCEIIREVQTSSCTVAVICPYRTQCHLIDNQIKKNKLSRIEVGTVDSFQGQERDIIILSCVRANNPSGSIGFLDNRKRMNVALTRARRAAYIVGHVDSLKVSPDWEALILNARNRNLIVDVYADEETLAAARILMR